jgi:hypothetical protein
MGDVVVTIGAATVTIGALTVFEGVTAGQVENLSNDSTSAVPAGITRFAFCTTVLPLHFF